MQLWAEWIQPYPASTHCHTSVVRKWQQCLLCKICRVQKYRPHPVHDEACSLLWTSNHLFTKCAVYYIQQTTTYIQHTKYMSHHRVWYNLMWLSLTTPCQNGPPMITPIKLPVGQKMLDFTQLLNILRSNLTSCDFCILYWKLCCQAWRPHSNHSNKVAFTFANRGNFIARWASEVRIVSVQGGIPAS